MPDKPEAARLTVIGEALVDLVPGASVGSYQAKPGGSPFNVAIGLARLGHRTTLMARLADTAFGRLLREHASAEGIDLRPAVHAAEPATSTGRAAGARRRRRRTRLTGTGPPSSCDARARPSP